MAVRHPPPLQPLPPLDCLADALPSSIILAMKTRAQKKKNKVNPTTPGKSPQLKSPPAIKTPGEDDDVSVASVSSAASALGRGVALHIQKGLAIAVEEGGGIGLFDIKPEHQKLSKLLDKYQEDQPKEERIFGERGDPIRRKLQRYIECWRKYHANGEYVEKVLNRFSVQSHKNLKKDSCDKDSGSDETSAGSSAGSSLADTPQQKTSAPKKPSSDKKPPAKKTTGKHAASPLKADTEREEEEDLEVPQTILATDTASVTSSLNTATDNRTMSMDRNTEYVGK
jgi:hypothetical protein